MSADAQQPGGDDNGKDAEGAPPPCTARWLYSSNKSWADFDEADQEQLESRWRQLGGAQWAEDVRARLEREAAEQERRESKAQGPKTEAETQQGEEDTDTSSAQHDGPPSGVDAVRSALADAAKAGSGACTPGGDKSGNATPSHPGASKGEVVRTVLDPDEPAEERRAKVPVLEDRLFDVDLETMELYPVFWKGVKLRVVRATWFYSSSRDGGYAPIAWDEPLAKDLDAAYAAARPWLSKAAVKGDGTQTPEEEKSEEKLADELCELPSLDSGGSVHFESPCTGRILTKDLSGRFLGILGGSKVVRGYEEAQRLAKAGGSFRMPEFSLPFASGSDPDAAESAASADERDTQDDSSASDSDSNEPSKRRGARRAGRKQGAARRPKRPAAAGGEGTATEEEDENPGIFGRMWPRNGWPRPDVAVLRALGWGKDGAEKEAKRGQRQRNTEQSAETGRKDSDAVEGHGHDTGERVPDDLKDEPPALVLCVHGIGQGLVEDFDALDFVYDIERLRKQSKKTAGDAGVCKISRGRRAQFLPISWRQGLDFTYSAPESDNLYSLEDVSNSGAIPMVRNVISKVILDVPYYLSRHRDTMIDAVKAELNRTYRLWCQRNPDFISRGGRVSLICHSLGSALAADILSMQPTHVPKLDDLDAEERASNEHLVFNVENVFFIGSPNGLFFHLRGAQLIARRRDGEAADDDATDAQAGRYGCLAARNVYNCYNTTDPVAYQLNAAVDREYSTLMRPVSIPEATDTLLHALALPRLSVSKLFDAEHPFASRRQASASAEELPSQTEACPDADPRTAAKSGGTKDDELESKDDEAESDEDEKERKHKPRGKGKRLLAERGSSVKRAQLRHKLRAAPEYPVDVQKLERAERRFRALNPHGVVDFYFESNGLNEYIDMLSAHISYWTSESFSRFVLCQVFLSISPSDDTPPSLVPELEIPPPMAEEEERRAEESENSDDEQGSGTRGRGTDSQSKGADRKTAQWEGIM